MPLVQVKVVEGVLTDDQKSQLISRITDAVLSVYGEGVRPNTWVLIEDVQSGMWGAGGKGVTAADVKALMGARAAT